MSNSLKTVSAALLVICLLSPGVAADPSTPLHIKSPFIITTDGGTNLSLPPSYILPEPTWNKLDLELKRLQERDTRLTAENKSLRSEVDGAPNWKWFTVVSVGLLVSGVGAGVYLGTKL